LEEPLHGGVAAPPTRSGTVRQDASGGGQVDLRMVETRDRPAGHRSQGETDMKKQMIIAAGVALAGAAIAAGVGGAVAAGNQSDDDGNDVPITGEALATASQVALDHVGEGRVTETEEGDEDSYYEVEVQLDNGDEIDVQLDRDFNVVGSETDGPGDD
jgi:uncharacterized membrane protein YkoI